MPMPTPTSQFYTQLPSFSNLNELTSPDHYSDVPNDWIIFLTDVKGSTKAIQEGRYKDVNTIGASTIIAAQNACVGFDFPFVFGGDGATLIVPPEKAKSISSALAFVRGKSRSEFKLDLRIAQVPVSDVLKTGAKLRVAKYEMSKGNTISMFSGGGLSVAEKMMKQEEHVYGLGENVEPIGDVTGLECRWNPIPAQRGLMLTIILSGAHIQSSKTQAQIFSEALKAIQKIAPDSRPIQLSNLPASWPSRFLGTEARMKATSFFNRLFLIFRNGMISGFFAPLIKFQKHNAKTVVGKYIQELVVNTDYLKFDDQLRMVIDVSEEQKRQILALLKDLQTQTGLNFGVHYSPEALMTCFVQSLERHVHFIDGGGGGYALAAQELKLQIKQQSPRSAM
jgi:hypothetical protein